MTTLLAISLGLGLATAAGLRVFLPLFGAGLAAHYGYIPLNAAFAWLAEPLALVAFGTATVLEVGAYYVPWLDHALDFITSPAALVAGVLATAAVVVDLPPIMRWTIAIVGGGGAAGIMQALSVGTRLKSSLATGGLGNPVVATAETVGSAGIVVIAVFVPLLAAVCLLGAAVLAFRWMGRFRRQGHT